MIIKITNVEKVCKHDFLFFYKITDVVKHFHLLQLLQLFLGLLVLFLSPKANTHFTDPRNLED